MSPACSQGSGKHSNANVSALLEAVANDSGNESVFDETYVSRFLCGSNGDVKVAQAKLQSHAEWRESYGANDLREGKFDFPELSQIQAYYPHGFHGVDRQNRPILIEQLGGLNMVGLKEVTTMERLLKLRVQGLEECLTTRFPATSATSLCVILDMKGLGLKHMSKELRHSIEGICDVCSNQYPEMLGAMFIINAPWVFNSIWKPASAAIDSSTRKKITVLDKNFQAKLHEAIDPDQLPEFLGGTCGRCTEGCLSSNFGPWGTDTIEIPDDTADDSQHFRSLDDEDFWSCASVCSSSEEECEPKVLAPVRKTSRKSAVGLSEASTCESAKGGAMPVQQVGGEGGCCGMLSLFGRGKAKVRPTGFRS